MLKALSVSSAIYCLCNLSQLTSYRKALCEAIGPILRGRARRQFRRPSPADTQYIQQWCDLVVQAYEMDGRRFTRDDRNENDNQRQKRGSDIKDNMEQFCNTYNCSWTDHDRIHFYIEGDCPECTCTSLQLCEFCFQRLSVSLEAFLFNVIIKFAGDPLCSKFFQGAQLQVLRPHW